MDVAIIFVSAYLLEYALSVDAALGIRSQCDQLNIPSQGRARVRRWALGTAITARLVILTIATHLAHHYSATFYVFGLLVLVSSIAAFRWSAGEPAVWRCGRLTDVMSIVLGQATFAIDSIALVSVSTSTLVVVTASVLATIAAHSVQASVFSYLKPPRFALGTLLGLLAIKLLAHDHVRVPEGVTLVAIVGLVVAAVVESSRR
jgi:predicted tellurium resistance membrane protein TerC